MSRTDKRVYAASALFNQMLCTVGDGTGTTEMTRSTSTIYKYAPASDEIAHINRLTFMFAEGSNEKFSADKYGVDAALNTGVLITVESDGGQLLNLTPHPIANIADFMGISSREYFSDLPSGSSDFLSITFNFLKMFDSGIILDGKEGEYLKVHIQGDASGIVEHHAHVSGHKE